MPGELRARALIGRDDELAAARTALASLQRGEGGLLLVTGEAGVGKSRLVREVTAYAAGSATVLTGRAVPGAGPLRPLSEALLGRWRGRPFPAAESLRPYRPALGRLLPGWSEPAGGSAEADSVPVLAEGVLELLATDPAGARWLVVLEDLHWADGETVAVLAHLAAAVAQRPVLVVATARTDEPGAVSLDALRSQDTVRELALTRLAPDGADQVAADCVGGAELPGDVLRFVAERADGLPLLVEEVLTGLVESGALRAVGPSWQLHGDLVAEVPAGLRQLVAARLDRLAPGERHRPRVGCGRRGRRRLAAARLRHRPAGGRGAGRTARRARREPAHHRPDPRRGGADALASRPDPAGSARPPGPTRAGAAGRSARGRAGGAVGRRRAAGGGAARGSRSGRARGGDPAAARLRRRGPR